MVDPDDGTISVREPVFVLRFIFIPTFVNNVNTYVCILRFKFESLPLHTSVKFPFSQNESSDRRVTTILEV